jgi:uncharacterized membrane protein
MPPTGRPTLTVAGAIGYAWGAFTKNLGPLVILALVVVGVQLLISLIGTLLGAGTESDSALVSGTFAVASLIFTVIAWVVGFVLAIGLIRAALAVMDGRTPTPSMLFQTESLGTYILAAILFSVTTFLGLLACIIPGVIIAFLWQFYGYAIVDGGPSVGATQALGRSFQVVKSNVGELLVLWLAFIGIFVVVGLVALIPILGWVVAFAAGLVLYPVVALSLAYAWRTLTGGVLAPIR